MIPTDTDVSAWMDTHRWIGGVIMILLVIGIMAAALTSHDDSVDGLDE